MTCKRLYNINGKKLGIICFDSDAFGTCYKCGKPSTRLCDFVKGASKNETCDRPMCDNCANSKGNDFDFCDEHFDPSCNKINIW